MAFRSERGTLRRVNGIGFLLGPGPRVVSRAFETEFPKVPQVKRALIGEALQTTSRAKNEDARKAAASYFGDISIVVSVEWRPQ